MKISETWLREWIDPAVDTATLAHQLTMAGLEVDAVEPAAPAFEDVLVGRVTSVEPHPDADKLSVCRVDVGRPQPLQVVCGAPNVRAGMSAPMALVGAVLPGGQCIERAELRGIASEGMLCSARELGLSDDAAGLMELEPDAPAGADLRAYLRVDDHLITIELTPNRGDCLSIAGVAREVAVINRCELRQPAIEPVPAATTREPAIRISAPTKCQRYAGRVVSGVTMGANTPLWMRERLRRSGLRPINPAVDVTNYVLLELGQPMHAFDTDKLAGGIDVRLARAGERVRVLNGDTVDLEPDCLVIADESGPVAFAGIMGGMDSAVGPGTTSVLLESACFTPQAVAGKGRRYKLLSDALYRYERGVDPALAVRALERATALLIEIAGGEAGPVVDVDRRPSEAAAPIHFRHARLERLLGTRVDPDEVDDILARLGMDAERVEGPAWRVRAPSFRYDIALEADLVEEVARVHGYDRLPERPRRVESHFAAVPEARIGEARLRQTLIQRGYQEAITYSFAEPALVRRVAPELESVALSNPIAEQFALMRSSLWASLLPVWRHNLQRQQSRVRLFEIGMRFHRDRGELCQETMVAAIVSGAHLPEQWGETEREADFFDLKGDLQALMALSGRAGAFTFEASGHGALHPGQSARIRRDGRVVGWIGRLHPHLVAEMDVRQSALLFEIELAALSDARVPQYQRLSEYPAVRRDLALVVDEDLPVGRVLDHIRSAEAPFLQDMRVFDVYRGKGLEQHKKSVALGLIFQDYSRTLTDREVDESIERLQRLLERGLGATIRG